MNRIQELIKQHCPDGVEFNELGNVMTITRGASPRPILDFLTSDSAGVPWIKIGDVKPNSKYITSTNEKITQNGASKSRLLKKGDFVLSNSMSFGRPYILKINGCIHDGWISMQDFGKSLDSDFLYHLLRSTSIQNYWKQKASSGTVQNLNASIVRSTTIPIPPLPIQHEIVAILDKFTTLEVELEAELESRKKQYEYYRDELFNFKGKEMKWETLGEIGEFTRGKRFVKTDIISKGVPCIHYGEMYTHYKIWAKKAKSFLEPVLAARLRFAKHGDVIIVAAGETIEDIGNGVAWLGKEDVVIHDACFSFRHKMNPKYVSYFFQTPLFRDQIKRNISSGKISAINASGLSKARIPVPSLDEQERVVEILDNFNALLNDFSAGLPAEIDGRRKQYEYYREKLLTFKPLKTN